ncbi:MAG TPA: hypothetical protein VF272_01055 [Candidatus Saccharimonadia bacterium]
MAIDDVVLTDADRANPDHMKGERPYCREPRTVKIRVEVQPGHGIKTTLGPFQLTDRDDKLGFSRVAQAVVAEREAVCATNDEVRALIAGAVRACAPACNADRVADIVLADALYSD